MSNVVETRTDSNNTVVTENVPLAPPLGHVEETPQPHASGILGTITEKASNLVHQVGESVSHLKDKVTETVSSIETSAVDSVHSMKERLTSNLSGAQETMSQSVGSVKESVGNMAGKVTETVTPTATAASVGAKDSMKHAMDTVKGVSQKVTETVTPTTTVTSAGVMDSMKHAMDTVKETLSHSVTQPVMSSAHGMTDTVKEAMHSTQTSVGNMTTKATDFVSHVRDTVTSTVESMIPNAPPTWMSGKTASSTTGTGATDSVNSIDNLPIQTPKAKELARESGINVQDYQSIPTGPITNTLADVSDVARGAKTELNPIVVSENISIKTEPSAGSEWREATTHHRRVQQTKEDRQSQVEEATRQHLEMQRMKDERSSQPRTYHPVEESAEPPKTDAHKWPLKPTTHTTENAWSNPEKTHQIIENLSNEEQQRVPVVERR